MLRNVEYSAPALSPQQGFHCRTSPPVLCGPGEGIQPCPSGNPVGGSPGLWGVASPKAGCPLLLLQGWTPPELPFVTDFVHNVYGQNF